MATDLEKKFNKAVWLIRNGPPNPNATTAGKLKFYSLYKQATEGDVKGAQPWAVQLEARTKWDAWAEHKGMSKEEAMQAYIDHLTSRKLSGFSPLHGGWALDANSTDAHGPLVPPTLQATPTGRTTP